MSRIKYLISLLALPALLVALMPAPPSHAAGDDLAERLSGRILIQVESHGEAWYVNPENGYRYYLQNGAKALEIMRELGLGASNNDTLRYIPVGLLSNNASARPLDSDDDALADVLEEALATGAHDRDSDDDGYDDGMEVMNGFDPLAAPPARLLRDGALIDRLAGHILLQVEDLGQAWYVDPVSQKRYYLSSGEAAYQSLRDFGLGITNDDLERIPVGFLNAPTAEDFFGPPTGDLGTNCGESFQCFLDAVADGKTASQHIVRLQESNLARTTIRDLLTLTPVSSDAYELRLRRESKTIVWKTELKEMHRNSGWSEEQISDGERAANASALLENGTTTVCQGQSLDRWTSLIAYWMDGGYDPNELDFADCRVEGRLSQVPTGLAVFAQQIDPSFNGSFPEPNEAYPGMRLGVSYGGEPFKGIVIVGRAERGTDGTAFEVLYGNIQDESFEEERGSFQRRLMAFEGTDTSVLNRSSFPESGQYGYVIQVTHCDRMERVFGKACGNITPEDIADAVYIPADRAMMMPVNVKRVGESDADFLDRMAEDPSVGDRSELEAKLLR